jgi:hypothetical protein
LYFTRFFSWELGHIRPREPVGLETGCVVCRREKSKKVPTRPSLSTSTSASTRPAPTEQQAASRRTRPRSATSRTTSARPPLLQVIPTSIKPSTPPIDSAKVRKSDKALELPQKGSNQAHEASPRALRRISAYSRSTPFEHAPRSWCICGQESDHRHSLSRKGACI